MAAQQRNKMIAEPHSPARLHELFSWRCERPQTEVDYISGNSHLTNDSLGPLEVGIQQSAQLVMHAEWFVEFIREAGVNDETTRKFDAWVSSENIVALVDKFVQQILAGLLEYINARRAAAADIRDRIDSRDADSGPPIGELAARVRELENLAQQYARRARALIELFENGQGPELVARLLLQLSELRPLTAAEKIRLLHS